MADWDIPLNMRDEDDAWLVEVMARAIADPDGGSVVYAHSTPVQRDWQWRQAQAALNAYRLATADDGK